MDASQVAASTPSGVFQDITLAQAILLLSLDDVTGQTEAGYYQPAFAGAALAELFLHGTIELQDDLIVPLRHRQSLGAFLDFCDRAIGRAPQNLSLSHWVARLSDQKDFVSTLADELCHLGALSKEKTRIFGLFSRTIWPEASPVLENRLKQDLRTFIADPAVAMDERLSLTLALADAVDLLKHNFSADELGVGAIAAGEGLHHPGLKAVLGAVKSALADANSSPDSVTATILQ